MRLGVRVTVLPGPISMCSFHIQRCRRERRSLPRGAFVRSVAQLIHPRQWSRFVNSDQFARIAGMSDSLWWVFRKEVSTRARGRSASAAATEAGLPRDAIHRVVKGHEPRLDRAQQVARALGFEIKLVHLEDADDSSGCATPGCAFLATRTVMAGDKEWSLCEQCAFLVELPSRLVET